MMRAAGPRPAASLYPPRISPVPLHVVTAGESHGPGLTCIVEGLPAGLELARRRSTATWPAASSATAAAGA